MAITINGSGSITGITTRLAAAAAPAGSVIQTLSSTKTDTFASSSTSYVDIDGTDETGSGSVWECNITPTASDSKILVRVDFNASVTYDDRWHAYQLYRDSTAIAIAGASSSRTNATLFSQKQVVDDNDIESFSMTYLDSPGDTSAHVYKIKGKVQSDNTPSFVINRSGNDTDATHGGRTVSTISVMEIAV